MALFTLKNKNGDVSIMIPHHSGVPGITENWPCELIMKDDDDRLEIRPRMSKNPSVFLPYNKITNAAVVTEQEIIEKSKSVLGRAAIGGLLLGPVGAIVGSTSGVGKKEKKVTRAYYIINYTSGDETKVLTFNNQGVINLGKFTTLLKERSGIIDQVAIKQEITL